jgi:hypothetical protein
MQTCAQPTSFQLNAQAATVALVKPLPRLVAIPGEKLVQAQIVHASRSGTGMVSIFVPSGTTGPWLMGDAAGSVSIYDQSAI